MSLDQDQDVDAVEKSRKALERKARLYESLQRRRRGSQDDDDDDLLIDFDQKYQAQVIIPIASLSLSLTV